MWANPGMKSTFRLSIPSQIADAHVYLDPENAQAPTAVDLLLGTQGWRRFALVDVKKGA